MSITEAQSYWMTTEWQEEVRANIFKATMVKFMITEQEVEAAALALYNQEWVDIHPPVGEVPAKHRDYWRDHALAALRAAVQVRNGANVLPANNLR